MESGKRDKMAITKFKPVDAVVAGASAFPQNSGCAPTGTVGALACWAADAIRDRYLKRPRALG